MALSQRTLTRRARVAHLIGRRKVTAGADAFRTALEAVKATTDAVKVPNGTTKKIGRIVTEALVTA